MVSGLESGASNTGPRLGRGHCVVFVGKILYSHSASLLPGVEMGIGKRSAGGKPCHGLASHPGGVELKVLLEEKNYS